MANVFQKNKNEIVWNLVNAGLAAGLVAAGALVAGNLNWQSMGAALVAGLIVGLTKFRDYWAGEQGEYGGRKKGAAALFNFV